MRIAVTAVAVLMAVATVAQAQPSATINIIHHNIHSGGQAQAAANHIEDLLDMTPQKAMVLCNEANYARQHFSLPHSGWSHIWPGSPFEGKGNPMFARNAVINVLSQWTLDMNENWSYNGNNRDPRVYTVMKCELDNQPWVQFHVINVHFPPRSSANATARQESIDRIIQASDNMPALPLIVCGDFNFEDHEVKDRIADEIGGKVYSNAKVDHIILRNGEEIGFETDVTVTRMGQYISDHQALKYNFTFKVLNKVIDNSDAGFSASGNWSTGTSAADKYGADYRFRNTGSLSDPATWAFSVPATSNYEIFAWWSQGPNRSSTAPYVLPDNSTVYMNQQTNGGSWQSLGTLNLTAGNHDVDLSCWTSNGNVVIGDAIRIVPR